MQVITVAPIVRGALQGTLTYFSKEAISPGMVVVVPIRSREVPAIVLESHPVSDTKEALKSSDYAIKKITRAKPHRIWLPSFLTAVEATANFCAQNIGVALLSLTPKVIFDAHLEGRLDEPEVTLLEGKFTMAAIQGDTITRYDEYRKLVRESFARSESVFLCLPTEESVARATKELGRGIEDYTFSFHSSISKKRTIEQWKKASSEKHAIFVVGTAQYLSLPRHFKTIILDEEHASSWKTVARPFLDLRFYVEELARAGKSSFVVGGSLLRAETYESVRRGLVSEFGRIAAHTQSAIKTILVDPRIEEKAIREHTGKREMVLFTKEARILMEDALTQSKNVLLLVARKGLAPITACDDCGTLIKCPACDTPLVIHKKESGGNVANIFVCHGCGFMRVPENNVNETCPQCGGWRLRGLGIGTDRVYEEVEKLFPDASKFILDGDTAKTRAQAQKIIERFEKTNGGILIATPMAIPLLGHIEKTIIVSIDSLFAIPDIRISERIFTIVLALREKTTESLLIQSRTDEPEVLEQALRGDLLSFTENELTLRKAFSYPPYGTIIKITLRGKRDDIMTEMERLKIFLKEYTPIVPSSIAREPKNIFRMHMILKLNAGVWPDKDLLAKLRALPPQFTIEVNPDHLL